MGAVSRTTATDIPGAASRAKRALTTESIRAAFSAAELTAAAPEPAEPAPGYPHPPNSAALSKARVAEIEGTRRVTDDLSSGFMDGFSGLRALPGRSPP